MTKSLVSFAALMLAACAFHSGGDGDDSGSDGSGAPPATLVVTSPARGTTTTASTVTVAGTVTGDGVKVTIDGADAPVAADGSFSATVPVTAGIAILQTAATDANGTELTDVRAVLAGPLAPSDGTHASSLAARASATALTAIGNAVAADAKTVDYTTAAQALNPVYDNTGCLGAVIDITSISLSNVGVTLAPQASALATNVTISNLVVKLHADYEVACIGGSTDITVTSTAAHIAGDLGASVSGGALATTLPAVTVTLDGFDLQVSGVPSEIVDLFNSHVQTAVQNALASMIQSKVPPIANGKLAGLVTSGFSTTLLGAATKLTIAPSAASITADGLYVAADAKVDVTGGGSGMFLTTQSPVSPALVASTHGLGIALSCDLANDLLAGLWAAGAFDKSVPIADLSIGAVLLDQKAAQVALKLSLPPTASADGSGALQLALGDALVDVEDGSGNLLQQIALSLSTGLSATAQNGQIALALGTPTVYAQVLEQSSDGSPRLTDAQVAGLVSGVWGIVGTQASSALAKLPLPSLAGVQLGAPSVSAASGYVVADVPIE